MTVADASTDTARPRAVTLRSVAIGLICTALVCGLSPVNDILYSDTNLTAGYLPLSAVLIEFFLIVVVNASLHRFAPRLALGGGELGVIVLMTLVACSLPSWGLARFLVPMPVMPFFLGKDEQTFWRAFEAMKLSPWLWPVDTIHDGRSAPAVDGFYFGLMNGERIPWRAWLRPAVAWGALAAALLTMLASLGRLIYAQWAHNERLPFPLVQVQAALIEPPERGRALNALFRSPSLWVAMGIVVIVHGLTMLNAYSPRHFNALSPGYDFRAIFAEPPLSYLRDKLKQSTLSFIVVGATYFIRSRAALSLWGVFLLVNGVEMSVKMRGGGEISEGLWGDQHLGACAAFALGMLFIGRTHWITVIRNAIGMGTGGDRRFRVALWLFVGSAAAIVAWLIAAGVTPWLAGTIVLFTIVAHVITSRVVAETGLPFFRSGIGVSQIYTNLPIAATTGRDIFFAGIGTLLGPLGTRDGLTGLTMHGLGVAESQADVERERRKLGGVIALTLIVGAAIAVVATIACQYARPTPTDRSMIPQGNNFGGIYAPMREVRNPVAIHEQNTVSGSEWPDKGHKPLVHMGIGFGIVTVLEIAALRLAWWPILPIGFVASYGAFIQNAWFSIFVGWLAKVIIVRFGGATLYNRARPFFVGLIFGESLMAALWLIVNVIVMSAGGTSQRVTFLL